MGQCPSPRIFGLEQSLSITPTRDNQEDYRPASSVAIHFLPIN